MNKQIKTIAFLGLGIALYVVLSLIMNIPLLAGTHLQTDLGYIAFGAYCYLFGWPALIVGVAGCFVKSLITSGWIPIGWMVGQAVIGIICGLVFNKTNHKVIHIITAIVAVFVGVGLIKTVIECQLYSIPFSVKFAKNAVAFVADAIPMVIGLLLAYRLSPIRNKYFEGDNKQ